MNRFIIITLLALTATIIVKGFGPVWDGMWNTYLWVTLVYVIGVPLYYLVKLSDREL